MGCTGPPGVAATSTAPAKPTSAGMPTPRQHHDHNELQLPYQCADIFTQDPFQPVTPRESAVIRTPSWASEATTSQPMNPMPTTAARRPATASCLIASHSATVREIVDPGQLSPQESASLMIMTGPPKPSSRRVAAAVPQPCRRR
jgi:hypothetical protein